jgi:transcriptional repressor NrdR
VEAALSTMILCPSCQSLRTKVLDVRAAPANTLKRRRECKDCEHRFTTRESVIEEGAQ